MTRFYELPPGPIMIRPRSPAREAEDRDPVPQRMAPAQHEPAAAHLGLDRALLDALPAAKRPAVPA